MSAALPTEWVVLLPVVLLAVTYVVVAADAVAAGRAAGRPVPWAVAIATPGREAVRLLIGQRRRGVAGDELLRGMGGAVLPIAALLAAAVLPLGSRPVADLSIGVVWFNAMEVLAWAAVWLVGWGANSTLSLIGGYRFVAQGLAYELPHMFALITAAVGAQSLRVVDVVDAQQGLWFVVIMPVAFVAFLLGAAAMAFWGPFDSPVGRDVAGGAAGELAGVDRLVFTAGRWLLLVASSAMAVPLFLGGGNGPWLPAWAWVLVKTLAVLGAVVALRHRVPTIRMERWTEFSWVVLVPATIAQALVVTLIVVAEGGI
ncbi:NADH-quinone oxidoreductase subunit H [Actinomycetospora rhizophila]|uniref:NADH-quinone oxidoreductase subunit H n=1 Tax=Actinomycetospora rhizophila TaxID=1416876 RepID=A0ABV9ZBB6_9PSEU